MFKNFFSNLLKLDFINNKKSLSEKDYPLILKKICYDRIREKLNLFKPRTFIDKIQWLKLYDDNPLKAVFTDKVAVQEWIKLQIGAEYLVPIYQICKSFKDIDFFALPEKFVVKTNHAEQWEYKIKNKEKFVGTRELYDFVERKFDTWQENNFVVHSGFEMQYKSIEPQIIVEKYFQDEEINNFCVYCFNGVPKLSELIMQKQSKLCVYDEKFEESEYTFAPLMVKEFVEPTDEMKKAFELSKKLSKDFRFVRVDWKIIDGKLYFDRMNFAPQSGFIVFDDENWNKELGELIKL